MWTEGPGNNSCTNNQHKASTLDTGFGRLPKLVQVDYREGFGRKHALVSARSHLVIIREASL